jgi:hypothetical protein
MGHRDDFNAFFHDPVNDVKGEVQKNEAAPAVPRFRVARGRFLNTRQRVIDLSAEFSGRLVTSIGVPL